jgi:hypothetical protein
MTVSLGGIFQDTVKCTVKVLGFDGITWYGMGKEKTRKTLNPVGFGIARDCVKRTDGG